MTHLSRCNFSASVSAQEPLNIVSKYLDRQARIHLKCKQKKKKKKDYQDEVNYFLHTKEITEHNISWTSLGF